MPPKKKTNTSKKPSSRKKTGAAKRTTSRKTASSKKSTAASDTMKKQAPRRVIAKKQAAAPQKTKSSALGPTDEKVAMPVPKKIDTSQIPVPQADVRKKHHQHHTAAWLTVGFITLFSITAVAYAYIFAPATGDDDTPQVTVTNNTTVTNTLGNYNANTNGPVINGNTNVNTNSVRVITTGTSAAFNNGTVSRTCEVDADCVLADGLADHTDCCPTPSCIDYSDPKYVAVNNTSFIDVREAAQATCEENINCPQYVSPLCGDTSDNLNYEASCISGRCEKLYQGDLVDATPTNTNANTNAVTNTDANTNAQGDTDLVPSTRADWLTYSDDTYNYSFQYPPSMALQNLTEQKQDAYGLSLLEEQAVVDTPGVIQLWVRFFDTSRDDVQNALFPADTSWREVELFGQVGVMTTGRVQGETVYHYVFPFGDNQSYTLEVTDRNYILPTFTIDN